MVKFYIINTYGVINSLTKEPVNENTLFEAGSITKPVFAFAVCRLMERGILDLDKPLYQYLPFDDVAHDERYKLITARHVLSHQTGFPNWADRDENGKFEFKFTPGTSFGYSGEGFEYLKRVVEQITQKDISLILEEEVLNPLNLRKTYFKEDDYLTKVSAHGHIDNSPSDIRIFDRPQMAYSMSTEAKSFSTFLLALQNKKGLRSSTYDEIFKVQTIIPKDEDDKKHGWDDNFFYGLGIVLDKSPYGLVYSHTGSSRPGFICAFNMFQDLNMGYVVFTNSYGGAMLVLSPLMELLITGNEKE